MNKKVKFLYPLIFILIFTDCEKLLVEPDIKNTHENVFNTMWTIMKEHYAFFESKGVDWEETYNRYSPLISNEMSDVEFYDVLSEMLYELKDGHTAVWSTFNHKAYVAGYKGPKNFDLDFIKRTYLSFSYKVKDGIIYEKYNDVGYMYVGDFSTTIDNNTIGEILEYFSDLEGIIIDVRNNGGGNLNNVRQISKHFFENKTLIGIEKYKNGPEPNDFVTKNIYVTPGSGKKYSKPCAVLINENCFSATNFFVWQMMYVENVCFFGDKTSGGGGHPLYGELPNGWCYRLSSSITYTMKGYNTDLGFYPNVYVHMDETDLHDGHDLIIDEAVNWILKNK